MQLSSLTPGIRRPARRTPSVSTLAIEFERRLSDQLDAEKDDAGPAFEQAYAHTEQVVLQILALPARSLDDLILKARALAWCHGDDFDGFDDCGGTTDMRLAASIIRDLLKMGRR